MHSQHTPRALACVKWLQRGRLACRLAAVWFCNSIVALACRSMAPFQKLAACRQSHGRCDALLAGWHSQAIPDAVYQGFSMLLSLSDLATDLVHVSDGLDLFAVCNGTRRGREVSGQSAVLSGLGRRRTTRRASKRTTKSSVSFHFLPSTLGRQLDRRGRPWHLNAFLWLEWIIGRHHLISLFPLDVRHKAEASKQPLALEPMFPIPDFLSQGGARRRTCQEAPVPLPPLWLRLAIGRETGKCDDNANGWVLDVSSATLCRCYFSQCLRDSCLLAVRLRLRYRDETRCRQIERRVRFRASLSIHRHFFGSQFRWQSVSKAEGESAHCQRVTH